MFFFIIHIQINLAYVPEQIHTLSCKQAFPETDENGRVLPFQTKKIPAHWISRGRVLLDPKNKFVPGSFLRVMCGKASVHRDNYRFETGLKWCVTNVVGSLSYFPCRPNLDGYLAFEVSNLDVPAYNLFVECTNHIKSIVSKNNFPAGSAVGRVVYRMIADLARMWMPLAPAHCQWISTTKGCNKRGAFVR